MTIIRRWNIKQRRKIKHKLYSTLHSYYNAHSLCNFRLQFIFTDRRRSSVNLGDNWTSHFCRKNMHGKLTKCPNFTYLPEKYFSWFFGRMPPFPMPVYFLSSTSVVQITRKFCAYDCSRICVVAGIFWIEFWTLLDDVTLYSHFLT